MPAGSILIYRKLSSPPQALRLRARLDTNGEKKNRCRIYDLGVVPTRGNNNNTMKTEYGPAIMPDIHSIFYCQIRCQSDSQQSEHCDGELFCDDGPKIAKRTLQIKLNSIARMIKFRI